MPAFRSGLEYRHDAFALHLHLYDGTLYSGKTAIKFRSGDLTISPPGVVSSYDLPKGGTHWCVHFQPLALPFGEPCFRLPQYLPTGASRTYFEERFRSIAETFRPSGRQRNGKELASAAAGAQLQYLLLVMAQHRLPREAKAAPARRSDIVMNQIRQEMELHFHSQLDVASLAASSGLSRNFFASRFRECFGMTVAAYLLHLRMEMAKNLTLSTARPIKEIAFDCGIPDANYFNKQFRRVTGMSPSRYRSGE